MSLSTEVEKKPKMEFQKRWYIGNQLGCEAKGCTKVAVWEWKGKESPYMAQLCDEHYHELKEAKHRRCQSQRRTEHEPE